MFEILLFGLLLVGFGYSTWAEELWSLILVGIIFLAVGFFVGGYTMTILENIELIIPILCGSMAVGSIWSLWKWRSHMRSQPVQDELREGKTKYDDVKGKEGFRDLPPFKTSDFFPDVARASKNVERISTWTILWPLSMVLYIFKDLLIDIGRWIYEQLGRVYLRITEAALPDDMK